MPCDMMAGWHGYDDSHLRKELSILTKLSCALLQALTPEQVAALPHEAQAWWAKHQEEDRLRLLQEQAQIKRTEDREAALEKLTPYERSLLGLK